MYRVLIADDEMPALRYTRNIISFVLSFKLLTQSSAEKLR